MAYLFEVQGKSVVPNTETLLISPFKEIWKRDNSKDKSNALEELTYIEFMTSLKKTNPFRQYIDDKKHDAIVKDVITIPNWKPDELVCKGIDKIYQFQKEASTSLSLFLAAKKGIEKVSEYLSTVDLEERTKSGGLVHKASDVTRTLNDIEKTINNFKSLEKKVHEELSEETKTRGGKEISPFALKDSVK